VPALLLFAVVLTLFAPDQHRIPAHELAGYRLIASVFERFQEASEAIARVTSRRSEFETAPLFSQEIAQGGDVEEVASVLQARLEGDAELSEALQNATISAHEYTKFAIALVGARLALGFLESGVLKKVPPGVASDNVAFVREHRDAVDAVLTELGIEIK
jgi:hypothetical protein